MDIVMLVIEILLCLFSVFIVAVVLLQSGKSAGLSGDIAGGAETFLGKSKAKSYEGKLKRLTKISAVGIMILSVGLVFIQVYLSPGAKGTSAASPTASAQVSTTPLPLEIPSATVVPSSSPQLSDTAKPSA